MCCEPVFSLIRAMTIIHCWNCFIDFNGLSYDGWANCPYFFTARTIFWGFGGLQKGSKQPRNAYVAISGSGSSKSVTLGGSWLDQDRRHTCWYVGIFFPFWHCHQGAPKGLKTVRGPFLAQKYVFLRLHPQPPILSWDIAGGKGRLGLDPALIHADPPIWDHQAC